LLEEALGVTAGPAKRMDRDIDAQLLQGSHIVRDEGFRGKWELHHDVPDLHRCHRLAPKPIEIGRERIVSDRTRRNVCAVNIGQA
jgi:hypothetical protein